MAKDVCQVLEIVDHRKAVKDIKANFVEIQVDAKGIDLIYPLQTAGGIQNMTINK